MPVGELFLSAFLQVLFDRLTSPELLGFLRQEGLYSKIKKWEDTLKMIQAVLGDAEDKQLKNRAVKMWLDDLQDLAYDVEDILDELATEAFARKLKMEQRQATKFWKLVPACFSNWSVGAIKFSIRMRSSVKDVTSRFDQLCKRRRDLGLKVITGGTSLDAALQRPPTSSHPTERDVYGRDADKAKILEMVLNNEPTDANFLVIPIVGMGGVGKTTLAREVFNDSEVESFQVKGWVCVSDGDFDVTRISKSILENITGYSCSLSELATVQDELKKKVTGKKFLLVLDDIWSKDYAKWKILQSPFTAGAMGSRIIVTTRHEEVASTVTRSGWFHRLGILSGKDCWSVFSMCAFGNNEATPEHPDMELIRENVIEKSKGLPLAAKTLGGLLGSKRKSEWLKLLNNTLWDLSENDSGEIPVALKLSYHHLPSHLKRCFAFCAIFPKDYDIEEEELVFLWMAQGLIQPSTRNEQPEELGREYIKDLLARSMFQRSSSNYNSSEVAMHDLLHDLAQWAFGETNIRLDGESAASMQWRELKKVRHFSYTSDWRVAKEKFAVFHEAEDLKARVRTFLPIYWFPYSYITNWVPSNLLPKLKRLRVLSLRSYQIFQLPNSIGGLKHLRYLNLSYTEIRSLPESTALLYNLQILMLRGCSRLVKLPSNFRYLIKLRHLDIRGAKLIKEMPSGMKELESLQMLSNFIVGNGVGSNLKDLKSLKMLHGELCISGLDNVADCGPTDLILRDKEDLKELLLEWGSEFDDSRNAVVEKKVLGMLEPHQHLEKLTIKCFGGTSFPSWVGQASFIKITVLTLQSCEKCTSLPAALGLLLSLKDLTIKGMKVLHRIGCEIYGDEKPFQSLKTLCFEDLPELENWEPNKENKYVDAFPCLQELSIVNCPKLSRQLPDCLPSLEKFVIKRCEQLVISFSILPLLCELEIDGCKGIVCNSPTDLKSLKSLTLADISGFGNWLRQQNFLKVECLKLKIMSYEQLINLWQLNETFLQKPPQGLHNYISITELQIENCSNLVSFPEVCFLFNLSSLEILNCDALTSLPKGMNDKNACLGSLKMKDCNSLTFIVRGKLPSSLKKLEIENCEKLEYLWNNNNNEESRTSVVDEKNPYNTNTSLLECLDVKKCPSLKCLSSSGHLPHTLRTLSLYSLPELESITKSFHDNMSLEEISVRSCRNLKSVPEGLRNLIHLRKIEIYNCESIDSLGEDGPNLSELAISECEKLKALPNWFHSLNSLKSLTLRECPSMTSFPEEGFPTNLTSLSIKCLNVKMYKAVLEWGLHNLTSLTHLSIWGHPEEESFPHQELEMTFPPSLTYLNINSFPNLKCLMGEGFQNLNSLESLVIYGCPNLKSFPDLALPSSLKSLWIWKCPNFKSFSKLGLPSSLLKLEIFDCPKLKEECKRDKGKEWSKISHIPCVEIDYRNIYDPLVEE